MDAELEFVARLEDETSGPARNLRGALEALGGPVDPITAALIMEALGLDDTIAQVDQAGERAEDVLDDSGAEAGARFAESAEAEAGELTDKLAGIGMAAGAAAAAAIGLSLYGAMNVEAANDKLTAQLGLTVDEAARLGKAAGDVYAQNWGEDLTAVNDAVAAVYSSIDGMTTASEADLESATVKALAFADAFEVDVARSAQVAGQMIRTGLADNADEAFDMLFAASQRVPAAIREDLLDAVDEYGPFFAAIGASGEQAFGALVTGSEQGMYGIDKVGDAIKEFGILAATDLARTGPVYEQLGLDAQQMANQLLAGGDQAADATKQIVTGLQGIEDPSEQAAAAIAFFGTPLEDLGVTKIPEFLDALGGGGAVLGDFEGAANDAATALGDNAASNLESFKRQAEQLAVGVIGGKLLPMVNDTAQALATEFGPTVERVTGWLSENERAVGFVSAVLGGAVGAILAIVGALKLWAAVQAILNVVLTANPIGIVIVAIAALVAGIIWVATQTTWFQDAWAWAWGGIQSAVDAVVGWWTGTVVPMWESTLEAVSSAVSSVADWFTQKWAEIRTAVDATVRFVQAILAAYVGMWVGVIRGGMSLITGAIEWFSSLPARMRAWWDQTTAQVSAAISGTVELARSIPGRIMAAVGNLGNLLAGAGRDVVEGLWAGISGAASWLARKVSGFITSTIPGPIRDALGIHSPSRVAADLAYQVPLGAVVGLERGEGALTRSAQHLAASMTAPLDAVGASWDAAVAAPRSVAFGVASSANEVVTVRFEVTSPDGSADRTAAELAALIANDPTASATVERATRRAAQQQQARTLVAAN